MIDPPKGKEEEEEDEDAICDVQVEQSENTPSSETNSDTAAAQLNNGEESLVCERRAHEYIYRMYEAVLLKAVKQQRRREDTYTWQVRSR